MGICDSAFNKDKGNKDSNKIPIKGSNFFSAPIDSSPYNDNVYVNDSSMSQTMTIDMSHYQSQNPPTMYQYINKYKTNGLQKSVAKASLVEMGKGNSLYSNLQNSAANLNSIYSSKIEETGYENSFEGIEMIVDGKMNEDLVQKSNDINTINNYNEFIKKKDNSNNIKNNKFMEYYHKTSSNSNEKNKNFNGNSNLENKEEDALSDIPLGNNKIIKI